MRQKREKRLDGARGTRRLALTAAIAVLASVGVLGAASPALASLKQDLERFANCPYNTPGVNTCVYSVTTSGEFVIGKGAVPISKPVTIQGGLKKFGVIVPATNGETLSKTPLPVPGGLVGIELPGNFTEVTATAELAGEAAIATSVALPLKVKLDNLALGGNCYIGSNTEPINLHLTYTKVAITGKDNAITVIDGTLADNTFAAPAARGCTLLPLVGDLAVNLKEGLPAPAGSNSATMNGVTEEAPARIVRGVLPLPALGRCLKLPGIPQGKTLVFNGVYSNSACTFETNPEKTGKYEWTPGPGPKPQFTGTGKALLIETAGKNGVTCTGSSSQGEYTGAKTAKLTLTLTGCQVGPKGKGVVCQSSGAAAGEIRSAQLNGRLDFIKENEEPAKPEVGMSIAPASGPSLIAYECGGKAASVGGSVIVPITAVDKMAPSFKLKAIGSGGKQMPEEFEGGARETLTFSSAGLEEQAGLTTTQTVTNEEPVEIKGTP